MRYALREMESVHGAGNLSLESREPHGLAHYLFQVAWMTFGVFLLTQAGAWFARASGGVISPIWPATGFNLALSLIYGPARAIPATYLGALASNFLTETPLFLICVAPLGYVLELVLSWSVVSQLAKIDLSFPSLRDFVKFVACGCIPGPVLGALFWVGILHSAGTLPEARMAFSFLDYFHANAFGTLIFGPFFLFALRRQNFRPESTWGRYEFLAYSCLLGLILWVLVNVPELGDSFKFAATGAAFILTLVVAMRFGLRSATLFQAMSVFMVPAFAVMVPSRIEGIRFFAKGDYDVQLTALGFVFLSSFSCLMVAAFRDELTALRLKFALAISSADLGIWERNSGGWWCHTPAWREKLGLVNPEPDSVILGLVHPDDLEEFKDNFRRLSSSEFSQWSQRCRMREAGGRWIHVEIDAMPLRRDADDSIVSIAGALRDITAELEAERHRISAIETEAQLRTLRAQINPHFLFNALSSIRALIGRQDAQAKTMITSLGGVLREVLAGRDTKLLPLEKEIEIVRNYLDVEAIRFGERLRYTIECPPDLLSQRIPGMVVLTLVENAVKHGVAKLEKGGSIEVRVARSPHGQLLVVGVTNDGPLERDSRSGESIGGQGLANVRERIELLAGENGRFVIRELPGPRVEAVITVPLDVRAVPVAKRDVDSPGFMGSSLRKNE